MYSRYESRVVCHMLVNRGVNKLSVYRQNHHNVTQKETWTLTKLATAIDQN